MRLFAVLADDLFDMDEPEILEVFNSLILALSGDSEKKTGFHYCNIRLILTATKILKNYTQ